MVTSSCLPRPSHSNFAIRTESLREWEHKPKIFSGTKKSGLDLKKQPRSSVRREAFFLTSILIELIDHRAGRISSPFGKRV